MEPADPDGPVSTGQPCAGDLARDWLAWCRGTTREGVARLLQGLGVGRRPPIGDAGVLGSYLVGRTGVVAGMVTVEYCRARAGPDWDRLAATVGFLDALERCRWEAFAAVYPDVAETCQILLRHMEASQEAVGPGLAAAAAGALLAYPAPPCRNGWDEVVVELHGRLGRALLAAPHAVHLLGGRSVARILEHLPYHRRIKMADRDLIANRLHLGLCGTYAELERTVDPPALLPLLAPPTALDGPSASS